MRRLARNHEGRRQRVTQAMGVFDENDSTMFVANRVIRGWTEGLGLLGEGGKAVLYIPSELAYGSRGNHSIAPNSTLIFDVEILKVGKFIPKEDNK
mgnify:CR=1 FL=1